MKIKATFNNVLLLVSGHANTEFAKAVVEGKKAAKLYLRSLSNCLGQKKWEEETDASVEQEWLCTKVDPADVLPIVCEGLRVKYYTEPNGQGKSQFFRTKEFCHPYSKGDKEHRGFTMQEWLNLASKSANAQIVHEEEDIF